jgi:hypothetical protein
MLDDFSRVGSLRTKDTDKASELSHIEDMLGIEIRGRAKIR